MDTALTSPEYDRLVWRPDWRGSICFLISGAIAYRASAASRMVAGARRRGMVAASRTARLHLFRNLGCRRLRRSVDRVDARPGGGQLEHIAGRSMLPGLCARLHTDRASKMPLGRSRTSSTGSRPTSGRDDARESSLRRALQPARWNSPGRQGATAFRAPEIRCQTSALRRNGEVVTNQSPAPSSSSLRCSSSPARWPPGCRRPPLGAAACHRRPARRGRR